MTTFLTLLILLAATAVVAWPIIDDRYRGPRRAEDTEISELLARKDAALLAISELEADFGMGNLSERDYREIRSKYDEQAVALLKDVDELRRERLLETTGRLDEDIEAEISRRRGGSAVARPAGDACPACKAPLPAGAVFCPRCGAVLGSRCPTCAAAVGADDRFCFQCGAALGNQVKNRPAE